MRVQRYGVISTYTIPIYMDFAINGFVHWDGYFTIKKNKEEMLSSSILFLS